MKESHKKQIVAGGKKLATFIFSIYLYLAAIFRAAVIWIPDYS